MTIKPINTYSKREEFINVISHAFGFVLSLVGVFLLLQKAIRLSSPLHIWCYLAYGAALLTLYAASTSYHFSKDDKRRRRLKVFDHAAIYVFIAGSYVPSSLIGVGGQTGWIIFIVVWTVALVGVGLKLFFTGRFSIVSTISYVLLGSVMLFAIKPFIQNIPSGALQLIFIGGIAFLLGAVLYSIKKIPYNHAIFHVLVLVGTIYHFLAIYWYL